MRIDQAQSLQMFARAGVQRNAFMRAVTRLGRENLKTATMRAAWNAQNPCRNYCYVISEWVKYLAIKCPECKGTGFGRGMGAPAFRGDCQFCKGKQLDPRVKAFKLEVPGDEALHNFCRNAAGELIDLAAEQFEDYSLVDYAKAKPTTFMQAPSKRAQLLDRYYKEELLRDEANKRSGYPITIEEHNGVFVLRDDLIDGTKRIYVSQILTEHPADEYVIATNPEGTSPVWLARACAEAGKKMTLVTGKRRVRHENTEAVIAAGGNVIEVETNAFLSHLRSVAKQYCAMAHDSLFERSVGRAHRYLVEFGGAYEFGVEAIAQRMRAVTAELGFEPDEVFCAVGSGTLLRGVYRGTDFSHVVGVLVGKEHTVDEFSKDSRRLSLIRHPLRYQQRSKADCPFPSNANYERKAWEVCVKEKTPGLRTLFWNVAS